MSSAVLYLAIVAVWGVVLVPMWLRRDGDGLTRLLYRRGESADQFGEPHAPPIDDDVAFDEPAPPVRRPRTSRAAVIARRRRRTLGLSLLVAIAIATVAGGLTPWWFVFPPVVLLAGHLSLLRVAVRMDAVRRAERRAAVRAAEAARRARVEREEQEVREAAAAERTAEVIELPGSPHEVVAREEVYDQYTDRRAVGD